MQQNIRTNKLPVATYWFYSNLVYEVLRKQAHTEFRSKLTIYATLYI